MRRPPVGKRGVGWEGKWGIDIHIHIMASAIHIGRNVRYDSFHPHLHIYLRTYLFLIAAASSSRGIIITKGGHAREELMTMPHQSHLISFPVASISTSFTSYIIPWVILGL